MVSRAFEEESPLLLAFFLRERRIMLVTIGLRADLLKGRVSRPAGCGDFRSVDLISVDWIRDPFAKATVHDCRVDAAGTAP